MKISIITVTYNSVETLEYAIQSVLNQTYPHIEYIIVDGGSNDGTIALLEKYSAQISKWISERDNGIYDAMNKGIDLATGDYIGFLNSDDILASNDVISTLVNRASDTNADVLYGDLEYTLKNDPSKVVRYWESCEYISTKLKKGWMPPHPTVYVSKTMFEQVGKFDLSFKISSDYEFILRLFSHPGLKATYLNQLMVKMRIGGQSNRSIKNIVQKSVEDYRALQKNRIGGIMTLLIKNASKLGQFIKRHKK
jgi:glycosyltransferase